MGATLPPHLTQRFEGLLSWARKGSPRDIRGEGDVYRLAMGHLAFGILSAVLAVRVKLYFQSKVPINEHYQDVRRIFGCLVSTSQAPLPMAANVRQ